MILIVSVILIYNYIYNIIYKLLTIFSLDESTEIDCIRYALKNLRKFLFKLNKTHNNTLKPVFNHTVILLVY